MSKRIIWLLRHGERLDFVDHQWMRKSNCSKDDPPLADKGRYQAEEVSRRLSIEKIDHIFSSPFQRCVETANFVAAEKNMQIKLEPGICEILWDFPPGYKSPDEHHEKFPLVDIGYQPALIPDQSEQYDSDCYSRVATSVERILDRYPCGDLLLVGHGASLSGVLNALIGYPAYQGLCTLTKLELDPDSDLQKCQTIFVGDASHLSDKTNLRPY